MASSVSLRKPDLRGVPKPWSQLTEQEKKYYLALKDMAESLQQEARDNNLFKEYNEL